MLRTRTGSRPQSSVAPAGSSVSRRLAARTPSVAAEARASIALLTRRFVCETVRPIVRTGGAELGCSSGQGIATTSASCGHQATCFRAGWRMTLGHP